MKQLTCFYFLFLSCCLVFTATAQTANVSLGDWQIHLPYNKGTCVVEAANKIYVGTEQALFSYDLEDDSYRTYAKAQGFSDLNITELAYNENLEVLVIAYLSGRIDLYQNGKVTNVSDIYRSDYIGKKQINHLLVAGDLVYIATNFGIVAYDLNNREVADSYIIGEGGSTVAVYQVAISDNNVLAAATSDGLYFGNLNNPNLAHFENWERTSIEAVGEEVTCVGYLGNRLFACSDNVLFEYDANADTWDPVYGSADWCIKSLAIDKEQLLLISWKGNCETGNASKIAIIDANGDITAFPEKSYRRPKQLLLNKDNRLWVADSRVGLTEIIGLNDLVNYLPNGPKTQNVFGLSIHDNACWVATGSAKKSNWKYQQKILGAYQYKDGIWNNYTQSEFDFWEGKRDLLQILPHPSKNLLYFASCQDGLFSYDFEKFVQYKEDVGLGSTVGDPNAYRITGLAFDAQENLWISNYGAVKGMSVLTNQGEWKSFEDAPFLNGDPPNYLKWLIVDDYNQKWIILHANGIRVFNHGADIMDESDDRYITLKEGQGKGGLPVNTVNCLVKDNDGAIWAGTDAGIAVYYCPFAVFESGCDAVLPYVEVDGYGAYLLEKEVVTALAVDGGNRKWVGTGNGLWLLSPDGTEVIHYFTVENSPLLSNRINSIAINNENGEVFVGTELGVVSYKGTATGGSNIHEEVLVYPNPVRPEYEGDIAVKGLARNAYVKITDISGNLIYETRANGGQAIWDGKNYKGEKVATGVYLIFSSSTNAEDHHVAKVMIVR